MNKTCDTQVSRRAVLVGGIAAASLLPASDANAKVKLSKAAVRFGKASSDSRSCASCKLFVAPSNCVFVEGRTEPGGACWIWRAKNA